MSSMEGWKGETMVGNLELKEWVGLKDVEGQGHKRIAEG